MKKRIKKQIIWLTLTALIMAIGLVLLKYLPMQIFGKNILFDASAHIVITSFILYTIYYFIDQNKNWTTPYFIFSAIILTTISIQRILKDKHNDIGIMLGFLIVIIAIAIPRFKQIKKKLIF